MLADPGCQGLALNEMSLLMASEWKAKPDLDKPLVFVGLEIPERVVNPLAKVDSGISDKATPAETSATDVFQGEWSPVRSQSFGRDQTDSDWHRTAALSVQDRQFTFVMLDGVYRGELLVDDSKIPKQVTFKTTHRNRMELRGIYRREGDNLTLCWIIWIPGVNELPRPTTFDTEKAETLKGKAKDAASVNLPKAGEVEYVFRRKTEQQGSSTILDSHPGADQAIPQKPKNVSSNCMNR